MDRKRKKWPLVVGSLAAVGCIGGGALMVNHEMTAQDRPAPLPSTMAVQTPGAIAPVSNADPLTPVAGKTLSPEQLKRRTSKTPDTTPDESSSSSEGRTGTRSGSSGGGSSSEDAGSSDSWMELRIPSMDVDMPVTLKGVKDGELKTGESRTMVLLNKDPGTGAMVSAAAGCEATAGTTIIAAHNQNFGERGPLYDLGDLEAGSAAYLTCANGQTSTWKQTSSELTRWANLDQGLFTKTGPRRLVVITCTGTYEDGYNVVKIFTPAQG